MSTNQIQIKITLPQELKAFLDDKANRFGLPVASYIRHLIINDVDDEKYPVYQASRFTQRAYKKALKEHQEGKTVKTNNVKKFFDEL